MTGSAVLRRGVFMLGLMALVALIGIADFWTGTELDLSIFFLVPISLAAWFLGRRAGLTLAVASAVAWFLADRYGGFPYSNPAIPWWNALMGLAFFSIIAALTASRRSSERRILELMEVKSEFASVVSHELRTPLTCIKEGIALVLDESPLVVGAEREHLEVARRNAERLARLVNDVLTFQKFESGRVELALEPRDLREIVREAVTDLALVARQRGLELELELPDSPLEVRCDADRIRLVVDNLLANALKFTERGGVRVRAERVPDGIRVAVRDTGFGIRREDQGKLFQGFSQIPDRARLRGEGTGLGLAIVRRIVELHGGEVGVDSSPGRGSTFQFTLPITPEMARARRRRRGVAARLH